MALLQRSGERTPKRSCSSDLFHGQGPFLVIHITSETQVTQYALPFLAGGWIFAKDFQPSATILSALHPAPAIQVPSLVPHSSPSECIVSHSDDISTDVALGAKSRAGLNGRSEATAEDVQAVIAPVMRHRIGLNFRAEVDKMTVEDNIRRLVEMMPAPVV